MLRRALIPAAWVSWIAASGCGLASYGPVDDATDPGDDAGGSDPAVLVVDVAQDRLAGPLTMTSPDEVLAEGLSLREAITIANNTEEADTIRFDPTVFVPGAPVAFDATEPLVVTGSGTHVDGGLAVEIRGASLVVKGAADVVIEQCLFAVDSDDAVFVDTADRVVLRDNQFVDSGQTAIHIAGSSDNPCAEPRVQGNRLERAGDDLLVVSDCEGALVSDNMLVIGDKQTQRGVHLERVTGSEISDNIIDPGDAWMVSLLDSSNNVVSGNILDGADSGVVLMGASNDNLIMQNVAMDMLSDGVYIDADSLGNTVVNNTLFRCGNPVVDGAADTTSANNLISADSNDFVDPTAGIYDFRLVADSPYIDAGVDMGFDCLPNSIGRYLGAAPDVGAVESY